MSEPHDPGRDADYAAAGFGGSLGFGIHPALLIIDFAMAYFERTSPLYAAVDAELAVTVALRDAADAAGVPVIFTRVEYTDNGRDGGLFYRRLPRVLACFDAGNPLAELHPRLTPAPADTVITKHFPSAFFGTDLAPILHARGIDTLVVTGVTTSGCVRASAIDALCHGFIPIIVRDACGDRDAAVQAANLFDLQAKTGEIVESAVVIDYFKALCS